MNNKIKFFQIFILISFMSLALQTNFSVAQSLAQEEFWFFNDESEVQTDYPVFMRDYLKLGGFIDANEYRLNGSPFIGSQWEYLSNLNSLNYAGNVLLGNYIAPQYFNQNSILNVMGNISAFGHINFLQTTPQNYNLRIATRDGLEAENWGIEQSLGLGFDGIGIRMRDNGTNKGFYVRDASSQQNIRFVISNNGNIGIGTTNPETKLHLYQGTFRITNSEDFDTHYDFIPTQNSLSINNSLYLLSNGNVQIGTTTQNRNLNIHGTIDASEIYKNGVPLSTGIWSLNGNSGYYNNGNIGIGTTVPKARLHVVEDIALGNDVNGQKFLIHTRNHSNGDFLQIAGDDVNGNWDWSKGITFVRSSGNVGVGTTAPKALLHVVEDIALGNDVNGQKFLIHSRSQSNGDLLQIVGDDANGNWNWSKGITFVKASGNVGIGTSYPKSKLSVDGNIQAKEIEVTLNPLDWPDYVFEKNYELMPLEALEEFVQTNKHLPEIETAEEIGENGLLLGDMQVKLLKKIEELTLYVIDINKEKDILKSELVQLKLQLDQYIQNND